ncbi:MAG: hypothetical protein Q7R76_05435 [Candidatus Woesearchaeota archaeon]|nr:hypothetical protein [Candidatus Woesearchaeota archaeon]
MFQKIKKYCSSYTAPAKNSFIALFRRPRFLLISALADFVFLFAYGLVTAPLVQKIIENLLGFVQCITKATTNQSPWTFLFWIVLYLVSVYLIYVVFQGVAWWAATKSSSQKFRKTLPLARYLFRFSKTTVPWYLLFVAVHAVSYFTTLAALAAQQTKDLSQPPFFVALFFIVLYFAFLSYALLPRFTPGTAIKKAFVLGIHHAHKTIPLFVVIGIVFYAANFLLGILAYALLRDVLALTVLYHLISAAVIFPFLCWTRLYLLASINKLFKF